MLPAVLGDAAARHGDRPAYLAPGGWPLTYTDLDHLSDEVAVGLARRGVAAGDLVALALPSSPEYVVAYLALAKLGAVTTGLNPRFTATERRAIVDRLGPSRLLATADLADGAPPDLDIVEVELAPTAADVLAPLRVADAVPPRLPDDPDREVAVVLTSGTTGTPRGAVFTNRQLAAIADIEAGARRDGGEAVLGSTELVHIGAMTKLVWQLRVGTTTHLMEHWRAETALRLVAEHRIRFLGGIPAQLALMLRHPLVGDLDLDCVGFVVSGGGPAPPSLVRTAMARFEAPFGIRYSSTETGGLGCAIDLTDPDDDGAHTVGAPRPAIELDVRDGEVWLRSPAAMIRYLHDPDATATTLVDGWVRTGDVGALDDRGRLILAGREREMYVRGGYNVHPQEVEAVLGAHPLVAEVAVAPRPDEVMGAVGVAVVVPADPLHPPTLDELRAHAAVHLARYKLPEDVVTAGALPLTAMHKLDRRALVRLVGG